MNCPSCGKAIENWENVQFCTFCGRSLKSGDIREESHGYSPWDDRANRGFFRALFETWVESIFRPTKFFAAMPLKGGYGGPLLYGFIVGEIAVLFSLFWQGIFMMMGTFGERYDQLEAMGLSMGMVALVIGALLSPVFIIMGYFITAAILHLCLFIVGGARRDFEATFRVICYAAGANLFNIIPFCGWLGAWLWNTLLNIIGVREAHEISTGRALLAYSLPAVACCGFLVLAFFLAFPHISEWFEYWGN
ncbi:MAG: YIP1 family protein [Gemmatimonadota bacterium]|nr:MAG: YIP1 family protein [Gemmatimonadota bacterium]